MSNVDKGSVVELSEHELDAVSGGAPPYYVPGAPRAISPGDPAGGGPAEFIRYDGSDTGRPDVILTPGAPNTVLPGDPSGDGPFR